MVRGINPLRYQGEESGDDTGWMDAVKTYFIPGMIVLAVIGVAMIQFQGSGGLDGSGGNSIFYDMGKTMFGALK
jgi:hypothetical protein